MKDATERNSTNVLTIPEMHPCDIVKVEWQKAKLPVLAGGHPMLTHILHNVTAQPDEAAED
jgi:hypothetical protein